jgi:hypothetical protein
MAQEYASMNTAADDPRISAWIRWTGYLAWVFLTLIVISILMVRSGNWQQGLALYALSGLLSMLLLAVFAVLYLLPRLRRQRPATLRRSLPAVPGAALLLMAMAAGDVPPIHDITTDTDDPPRFEKAPSLRGPDSNPLEIRADVIEQQKAAYPTLDTLRSPRSFARSYNLALNTARAMGWEITREDPNAGFIEAVATTPIMNFRDDVVIRVRTNAEGSLIDLRSVSRVGRSDLGANAARIRAFLDAFRDAADPE